MSWTILKTFETEAEGRVAESFLKAHGFEVQLLDTHTPTHRLVPTLSGFSRGPRMMVRADDEAAIRELLEQNEKRQHLSLVGIEGEPINKKSVTEKWLITLLILLAVLVFILTKIA